MRYDPGVSVSLWNRSASPGRRDAEVVVLGGGIVGLAAAHALVGRGVGCLVLERGAAGSGASTRNAGFLMRGAATNYAQAVEQYGRETAQAVWRLTEENLEALSRAGAGTLPSFERRASCLLGLCAEEAGQLRESSDLLREDGFSAELVDACDGGASWAPRGAVGLLNPRDAVVNPRELIDLIAAPLGDRVVEGCEVTGLDEDGDGVVVRTPGFVVRCARVLVCMNAFAPLLLGTLSDRIIPARGQMIALRARRDELALPYAYYANWGSEYFRRVDDQTVIVGGWRQHDAEWETTYEDLVTDRVQSGLEAFAADLFRKRLEVVARWSGTMGFTQIGLPITGPVTPGGRVWACAGFTGHGMSLGWRTAELTVGAMLDGSEPPFVSGG